MHFDIVTIFPDIFENFKTHSLIKRALDKKIIDINVYNLRDWSTKKNVHKQIDDRPYGGGAGMLFMIEPMYEAIVDLNRDHDKEVVIFSPSGITLNQVRAQEFAVNKKGYILLVPHYEGFDHRILKFVDHNISIGDYVLSGGELPAMTFIDSISRLQKGFVGNELSIHYESYSKLDDGVRNVEYPQYTRPEVFIDKNGVEHKVPPVLLEGDHKKINEWRSSKERIKKTDE